MPADRFLISADATFCDYVTPADVANYPGWIDCSDMSDEELQRFVAERQAVRPYVVGMAIGQ